MEKKYVRIEQPIEVTFDNENDNENDIEKDIEKDFEKDFVNTKKRSSSVIWDMDIWLTLGDLKRKYKIKIHDYINYKMRKVMEEEYPNILKRNKDFFSGI